MPLVVAAVLLLSGCTVPAGGHTAVGVDDDGAPVAFVVMCEGRIDGLTLYFTRDEETPTVADLESHEPVTTTAEVPLASPGSGWTTRTPLGPLVDGVGYSLYGWTRDNEWSSDHVTFTTASLAGLRPGQVLRQRYDDAKEDSVDVVSSVFDFRSDACSDENG